MSSKRFVLIAFTFYCILLSGQTRFRVMEYNVENLFDCRDDSLKADEEFLPGAVRRWNPWKYWTKLNHLSQVIASCAADQIPDLVALCEVENDSVVYDLTKRSALRNLDYRFVITHSDDARGIDVALLYQRSTFKVLCVDEINVHPEKVRMKPTRNILHVCGLTQRQDTLDVFVCHMPSRSRGLKQSIPYRKHTCSVLRTAVDALFSQRKAAKILITGDFNDHPEDAALSQVLQAKAYKGESPQVGTLYNLTCGKKPGTYKFRGKWELIDQMIVSGSLLNTHPDDFHTSSDLVRIHQPEFLLTEDRKQGGKMPFRTFNGMRYQGGYSDHLPLVADFCW